MKKFSFSILFLMLGCLISRGQVAERNYFNHLEIGATIGTPGLGVDLSTPVGKSFRLRAGMTIMPHFTSNGQHDVYLNSQPTHPTLDGEGKRTDRMGKLMEMMRSFTGYEIAEQTHFYHKTTMWNAKLLMDWYPSGQPNWRITAGFMIGPSEIARICNEPDDMPGLTGMSIYNGMYEKIMAGEPILSIGGTTVGFPEELAGKVKDYGRMSIPAGVLADGSPYSFDPGADGLAEAVVETNAFRPYLGMGYTYWFEREQRTSLAIDAGFVFWGGKPAIRTANGVDLNRDMRSVSGDIGEWVNFYSKMLVLPVLELRISRRLF